MPRKRSLALFEDKVIDYRQAHARATSTGYQLFDVPRRTFATGLNDYAALGITGIAASLTFFSFTRPDRGRPHGYLSKDDEIQEIRTIKPFDYLNVSEKARRLEDEFHEIAPEDRRFGEHPGYNFASMLAMDWLTKEVVARRTGEEPDITSARDHYMQNRQAYMAMALAEAYADGVEINLDPSVILDSVTPKPTSSEPTTFTFPPNCSM